MFYQLKIFIDKLFFRLTISDITEKEVNALSILNEFNNLPEIARLLPPEFNLFLLTKYDVEDEEYALLKAFRAYHIGSVLAKDSMAYIYSCKKVAKTLLSSPLIQLMVKDWKRFKMVISHMPKFKSLDLPSRVKAFIKSSLSEETQRHFIQMHYSASVTLGFVISTLRYLDEISEDEVQDLIMDCIDDFLSWDYCVCENPDLPPPDIDDLAEYKRVTLMGLGIY
jgi:hypothetical protein